MRTNSPWGNAQTASASGLLQFSTARATVVVPVRLVEDQDPSLPFLQPGTSDAVAPEEEIMASPSREEIDAKFALVEQKAETRFVEIGGKIDRVFDSLQAFNTHVSDELGFIRSELTNVKSDNKWTRWTIIIAVVTSLIGGIAALWVTQSNMLASFSAGIAVHETQRQPTPVKP